MTEEERAVLNLLAEAWNAWLELGGHDQDEMRDFRASINSAQRQIALRVASRVDPTIWRQS